MFDTRREFETSSLIYSDLTTEKKACQRRDFLFFIFYDVCVGFSGERFLSGGETKQKRFFGCVCAVTVGGWEVQKQQKEQKSKGEGRKVWLMIPHIQLFWAL
jgi:hypothetical protein